MLERNGRFLPVGVSLAERPLAREGRALGAFLEKMGPAAPGAVLLHVGPETTRLAPGIWAVPWWRVL
ncbi:MAG: hypothetical protein EXR92_02405 [Gemmatimonadetes bacterium]|nr:hypothetical protein [Gemmatimonadota bacterium]